MTRIPNANSPVEIRKAFQQVKLQGNIIREGALGEILVGVAVGVNPAWGTELTTLTLLTVDNISINGAVISSDTGAISFSNENLTTTGTVAGINITSGTNPGHIHTDIHHGDTTGLGDDDHTQYHTDARGDARYYTETELDAGQLDTLYFQESEFLNTSAGAGDEGKPIKLDASGQIDSSMIGAGGSDEKVGIDSVATAGYIGAASSDGVLRTSTGISYADGGNFVTLTTNDGEIVHDNLSSKTIAGHDTTATGANLTSLTDDSMVDSLHRHSELSASDGTPNPALQIDASGNVDIGTPSAYSNKLNVHEANGWWRVYDYGHTQMHNSNSSKYWGLSCRNSGHFDIAVQGTDPNGGTILSSYAVVTILSSGFVGLWTRDPLAFLQIGKDDSASNEAAILFGRRVTTNQTYMPWICQASELTANGNDLFLGTGSVDGGIVFATGGTATPFSPLTADNKIRVVITKVGEMGIGDSLTAPDARFEIQTGATEGKQAITIDQNDIDKAFIDFQGTSAADVANNITTWTAGCTIQGFILQEINGTERWMPFYDAPSGTTEDINVDHSGVSISAGSGLIGGGDITTTRTLSLDINGLAAATIVAGDFVPFWDITATATNKKTTFANFEAALTHDNLIAGTIADHDTGATGAELDTLTDDSMANVLHRHSELSASDGAPNAVLSIGATGLIVMYTPVIHYARMGIGRISSYDLEVYSATGGASQACSAPDDQVKAIHFVDSTSTEQWVYSHRTHADGNEFWLSHYTGAAWSEVWKILPSGYTGINTSPDARFEVETETDEGKQAITIDQNDIDQAFIDFQGESEAGAAKNLSTWTNATLNGFVRMEINGAEKWVAYYNAPTS